MTIMREFIIADNQDITKAGMMFLLSRQKDTALLLEADNKAELIQQLRLHPGAVVILDYTSFDFVSSDELIVLHERFKEADWLLFSDELSIGFLRQVLFSSMSFGVVLKDNSKEEILTALQCASRKERFICNHVSNLLLSGNSQTSLLLGYLRSEDMSSDMKFSECDLDKIIREHIHKYASVFIGKKLQLDYERTQEKVLTDPKWLGFVIGQKWSLADDRNGHCL